MTPWVLLVRSALTPMIVGRSGLRLWVRTPRIESRTRVVVIKVLPLKRGRLVRESMFLSATLNLLPCVTNGFPVKLRTFLGRSGHRRQLQTPLIRNLRRTLELTTYPVLFGFLLVGRKIKMSDPLSTGRDPRHPVKFNNRVTRLLRLYVRTPLGRREVKLVLALLAILRVLTLV